MKPIKTCQTLGLTALATLAATTQAHSQSAEALINKLVQKGVLTEKEGKDLMTESSDTNLVSASKWRLNEAIKSIGLFGDVRFRYEYRGADNAAKSGATGDDYARERFRYAFRLGLKGDLFDNFYYGLRLETSTNPRSPWVTFGDDTSSTPSAKNSDGINIGQAYLGWRPASWYEMTVGKFPMPLYVTPMVWDTDINPEGAVEKLKFSAGNANLFANFGQFLYQNANPSSELPSGDTFMLAWQVGADVKLTKNISVKIAPVLYNYTGFGQTNLLNEPYVGEGASGLNVGLTSTFTNAVHYNQSGINDLLVLEVPAEVNFKVAKYNARAFGDFAYNFQGNSRARAAANEAGPTILSHPYLGEDKAYQIGLGFGNLGLVYGQTSKKHTWEARAYWQHIEQYALDVNLIDSDFFEGRANLEGVYTALAYSFTDSIIGTVRYGYAHRINNNLGTGGTNPDLPILNPVNQYHLLQLDVTWRF
jgi:hypothetical protein